MRLKTDPKVITEFGNHLKENKVFKKTFGEVFTPIELVDAMLDKLPKDIWRNPDLTWLDPACGTGNFLIRVKERLMESLKKIPDPIEREQHILTKMLYGVDIQPRNCVLACLRLSFENKFPINIACTNSLKFNFWNKKFDIIVGNPPYQDKQKVKTGKRGGGTTLWDKFTNLSIDLSLVYICLITPCGWRNSEGEYAKLGERIKSLQLHYLEMHDSSDGLKTFGAGTSYDWYVLEKVPYYKKTKIKCQDGTVVDLNLSEWKFIPSGKFEEIKCLLAKKDEEKLEIIYSRSAYGSDKSHVQKEKDSKHPYPVVHNVRTDGQLSLIYSSHKNNGHFGVPKIIFGRRQCGTFVDKKGIYGLSQDCRGMLGQIDDLDKINEALNNPKFIEICKYLSLNSTAKDKYDHRILRLFKKDFWKEFL
jgi:hypothetical protein